MKINDFQLKEIDKDKLYKFLREMEFNRLLSSAISAYGEPNLSGVDGQPKIDKKEIAIDRKKYSLIKNSSEIDNWIKEAEEIGEVAVDTETNSLDPHQAELVGISLSTKIGKACYIPVGHNSKKKFKQRYSFKKNKTFVGRSKCKENRSKYKI